MWNHALQLVGAGLFILEHVESALLFFFQNAPGRESNARPLFFLSQAAQCDQVRQVGGWEQTERGSALARARLRACALAVRRRLGAWVAGWWRVAALWRAPSRLPIQHICFARAFALRWRVLYAAHTQ